MKHVREESFVLAYSQRGSSPSWQGVGESMSQLITWHLCSSSHEQIGSKAVNFGVKAHPQWPTSSKETPPPKVSTAFQNSTGRHFTLKLQDWFILLACCPPFSVWSWPQPHELAAAISHPQYPLQGTVLKSWVHGDEKMAVAMAVSCQWCPVQVEFSALSMFTCKIQGVIQQFVVKIKLHRPCQGP